MRIAVIPARGGSKRIPRKNIRPFHGKPIIAWSIEAAIESGCFDQVIVSTDDAEIAAVAREFGAATPFTRPPAISDDFTPIAAVMKHAADWFADNYRDVDYCCCIYATAPFVEPAKIRLGLDRLIENGTDFALSVTSFPAPIQRAYRIQAGRLEMIDKGNYLTRSQDLETCYHDAGQFCWGSFQSWSEQRSLIESATPVLLRQDRVQDIDTPEDWARAEFIMSYFLSVGGGEGGIG